jgi:hypothetical protein
MSSRVSDEEVCGVKNIHSRKQARENQEDTVLKTSVNQLPLFAALDL